LSVEDDCELLHRAKHEGVTTTIAEHVFVVKGKGERVFAPNM